MALQKKLFIDLPSETETKDPELLKLILFKKTFFEEQENGWSYLHRNIRDKFTSTKELLDLLMKTYGVDLSVTALDQNISRILEGKGLLQNPYLLSLVCRVLPVDMNRVLNFDRPITTLVDISEQSEKRLVEAIIKRESADESAKKERAQSPRRGMISPKSNWIVFLKEVHDNMGTLVGELNQQTLMTNPYLSPLVDEFYKSCLKKLPGFNRVARLTEFESLLKRILRILGQDRAWTFKKVYFDFLVYVFSYLGVGLTLNLFSYFSSRKNLSRYGYRVVGSDRFAVRDFINTIDDFNSLLVEFINEAGESDEKLNKFAGRIGELKLGIDQLLPLWSGLFTYIAVQLGPNSEEVNLKFDLDFAFAELSSQKIYQDCYVVDTNSAIPGMLQIGKAYLATLMYAPPPTQLQ